MDKTIFQVAGEGRQECRTTLGFWEQVNDREFLSASFDQNRQTWLQ
jgi:hypothetical protein